jgi:hypothetical protein
MTRFVAFRVFMIFITLAALSAATGLASQVPLAEVLFLVSASLGGIMLALGLALGLATPAHAPVPVRVRRRR